MTGYDVAVVGAGMPGLRIAGLLAERGLRVAVFEQRTVASESSALAAGHVPQRAYTPTVLRILERTRSLIDGLDRRTGGVVRFNTVGGLMVSRRPENEGILARHTQDLAAWGIPSELLSGAEVRQRWPAFDGSPVTVAHWCAADGFVRALDLTVVLAAIARHSGVEIFEGCPVDRIALSGSLAQGVIVAGQLVAAAQVVLAAGAWSGGVAERSGISLPLRLFSLAAITLMDVPAGLPFVSDLDSHHYLVPRSAESLLLGLPPRLDVSEAGFSRTPLDGERAAALRAIEDCVPGLQTALAASGWAGLLATTPDGSSLLGPHPEVSGLHLATGFGGAGLQWIGAADAVADVVLGEPPFFDWATHRASRFAGYAGEDFAFQRDIPTFYDDRLVGETQQAT